jgi:Rab3 GTPase-activating protein catalytic subunit
VGRLVSVLSLAFGAMGTLRGMAALWVEVVRELRWRWEQGRGVPRMRPCLLVDGQAAGAAVDLAACLLHQKLQVLQRCVARRREEGGGGAEEGPPGSPPNREDPQEFATPPQSVRSTSGVSEGWGFNEQEEVYFDLVDQCGVALEGVGGVGPAGGGGLYMLARGREEVEIAAPAVQEACPTTEDQLLQVRMGGVACSRVRVGECSSLSDATVMPLRSCPGSPPLSSSHRQARQLQARMAAEQGAKPFLHTPKLASDMSAFKAANPRATLADFVRWRAPELWAYDAGVEGGDGVEEEQCRLVWPGQGFVREEGLAAGLGVGVARLKEVWVEARPVPAKDQKPLFNAAQEAEKVRGRACGCCGWVVWWLYRLPSLGDRAWALRATNLVFS